MDRRNFLSSPLAASASLATAGNLLAQAGFGADKVAPEYMDLRPVPSGEFPSGVLKHCMA